MKTETFPDGSTIDTDETTGNSTVCGKLAHDEYFKRLREEKIFHYTETAVMAFCVDTDGTRKAELIRKRNHNPLTIEQFGEYSWEVWDAMDPQNVTLCASEDRARKLFKAVCLHGTNGYVGECLI